MVPTDDRDVKSSILLKEYDILYSQYCRTIDERNRSLDLFFVTVSVVLAVIACVALALFLVQRMTGPGVRFDVTVARSLTGFALVVLLVVGVSMLTTFVLETKAALRIMAACRAIRDYFREAYDELGQVLVIDTLRGEPTARLVAETRVVAALLLNGGMAMLAHLAFASGAEPRHLLATFFFAVVGQFVWLRAVQARA